MQKTIYPFTFTQRNFSTREQTAALLQPALEKGIITPHDFQAAIDFYPRGHRTYFFKGIAAGAAGFIAFDFLRPVPIRDRRYNIFTSVCMLIGGGLFGLYSQFRAHKGFINSLDDRYRFWCALEGVNTLVGGSHIKPLELPLGPVDDSARRWDTVNTEIRWQDFFDISRDPLRSGAISSVPRTLPDAEHR